MAGLIGWIREKMNPAQRDIQMDSGTDLGSDSRLINHATSFESIEVVNRCVNMLVSGASSLDYDVKEKVHDGVVTGVRQKALNTLLNFRPNPYQSAQDFRQNIFSDLLFDGNVFIYYDGAFLYHLPAHNVKILTDDKTFVKGYEYGTTTFAANEVFHFKDVSSRSIYRGTSRLNSCLRSVNILKSMHEFQENFFDNGAVFGLVLTTENTLGATAKDKTIKYWLQNYSVKRGGKRPVILDSGLKPHNIAETNFKDMDFDLSIKTHSEKIMQALGVPQVLLYGGNNANISPNLRLFYLETVLPMVKKFTSAVERYFGYDISPVVYDVSALQPDLKDLSAYNSTLVNAGIITVNEARDELRYEPIEGGDELRIPANIAGSAANPSQGGRPPSDDKE